MTFKGMLTVVLCLAIAMIIIMAGSGFKFWWASEPDASQTVPVVKATIDNPNPPQPNTTCMSYGVQRLSIGINVPFWKSCKTVYK